MNWQRKWIFSDNQYEWMLRNLPFRLMYRKVNLDDVIVYKPIWGWTKRQISDAEKKADDLMNNLNWK